MNIFGKLALSGLVLCVASVASAASVSGSTDFRVTLPEVLVLYHWDDAHLTLTDIVTPTAANDSDAREISDTTTRNLTDVLGKSAYTVEGTAVNSSIPDVFVSSASANVTLKNSWAVRSISSGDVTLGLSVQQDTLKNVNNQNSTITVSKAGLASTGTGIGGSTTAMTIPSGWQGVQGDINFTLDLTKANNSGEYNTRGIAGAAGESANATDTFLLTLTGLSAS